MAGFWQLTGTTTLGSPSVTHPAGSVAAGAQIRVRAISGSVGGTAGALVVSDSALGTIWQVTIPINGMFAQSQLDLRGSVGGDLTITLANGTGLDAQGDFIPIGYPYGLT